jgi:ABC-type sugar transport system ATPase subunit
MAQVRLDEVTKEFTGGVRAVSDVSLEVPDGEFLVLVGPSGCGKTTALRLIAGLEKATSGTITIGSQVVNGISPRDRDIAMVFQNYALYPHMTVHRNLAFPLRERRTPRPEVERRVAEISSILGLDELLKRRPAQLSGGGWRWGARWSVSHRCSCSTSRCRTWTPSSVSRCGPSSSGCTRSWGSPPSM